MLLKEDISGNFKNSNNKVILNIFLKGLEQFYNNCSFTKFNLEGNSFIENVGLFF